MRLGIYMGRFSPLHLGHEFIINRMLEKYDYSNCQIVLGSCNNPLDERHLFSYKDRREFIKEIYPNIDIIGLADHKSDEEWLCMLLDLVTLMGCRKHEVEFFSGYEQDVVKLIDARYTCTITNRYDGSTPLVSATQVRETLVHGGSLKKLVNPKLIDLVSSKFKVRYEEYQDKLIEAVNMLKTFRN